MRKEVKEVSVDAFMANLVFEIDTEIEDLIDDAESDNGEIFGADCTVYYKDEIVADVLLYPCGYTKFVLFESYKQYESIIEEYLEDVFNFDGVEMLCEAMDEYNDSLEELQNKI